MRCFDSSYKPTDIKRYKIKYKHSILPPPIVKIS